jgi:hypothetical protein
MGVQLRGGTHGRFGLDSRHVQGGGEARQHAAEFAADRGDRGQEPRLGEGAGREGE